MSRVHCYELQVFVNACNVFASLRRYYSFHVCKSVDMEVFSEDSRVPLDSFLNTNLLRIVLIASSCLLLNTIIVEPSFSGFVWLRNTILVMWQGRSLGLGCLLIGRLGLNLRLKSVTNDETSLLVLDILFSIFVFVANSVLLSSFLTSSCSLNPFLIKNGRQ